MNGIIMVLEELWQYNIEHLNIQSENILHHNE